MGDLRRVRFAKIRPRRCLQTSRKARATRPERTESVNARTANPRGPPNVLGADAAGAEALYIGAAPRPPELAEITRNAPIAARATARPRTSVIATRSGCRILRPLSESS